MLAYSSDIADTNVCFILGYHSFQICFSGGGMVSVAFSEIHPSKDPLVDVQVWRIIIEGKKPAFLVPGCKPSHMSVDLGSCLSWRYIVVVWLVPYWLPLLGSHSLSSWQSVFPCTYLVLTCTVGTNCTTIAF
jgi:hypothetical protein